MPQNQNLLKTDMLCFALIDEPEPFFLDMPVNVSIAVFKRHGFTTSGTCKQICRWHQQPVPADSFQWTDLIPVKGQFVLYLTAEHLYWPAFHINVQNFLGAQGNIRADENTQGSGIQEHILRMAEQNYGIFNAIETPFRTADIITQLPEVTRLTAASVFRRWRANSQAFCLMPQRYSTQFVFSTPMV